MLPTTALHNCSFGWMESGDPGERNFTQGAFDSTRRKWTNQCRILVQSCGFVWKARKMSFLEWFVRSYGEARQDQAPLPRKLTKTYLNTN